MSFNPNRYSGQTRRAQDIGPLMRDINTLEGFKADQTLETNLTPQYGIIIGAGASLVNPTSVGVDSSGNIYVADRSNNVIVKFTAAGNYVMEWGVVGSNPGEFTDLRFLSVAPDDTIWAADSSRSVAIAFDTDGNYISEFSTSAATVICAAADGYIYAGASSVLKYNTSGSLQATYSSPGVINSVSGIVVRDDGRIYVSQQVLGVGRAVEIDPTGPVYTVIGTAGTGAGQCQRSEGVAIDANGNLFVADSTNDKILIYNASLAFSSEFGTSGTGAGQFQFPHGLCIVNGGRLLIVDSTRALVIIYDVIAATTEEVLPDYIIKGAGDDGNLYAIPSFYSRAVYKLTTNLVPTLFVTITPPYNPTKAYIGGIAADSSGTVWISVLAQLTTSGGGIRTDLLKYNSSGVLQTTYTYVGKGLVNIAHDGSGGLFGQTSGNTVGHINSSGVIDAEVSGRVNSLGVDVFYGGIVSVYSGVMYIHASNATAPFGYNLHGYSTSMALVYNKSIGTSSNSVENVGRFGQFYVGSDANVYAVNHANRSAYKILTVVPLTFEKWPIPNPVDGYTLNNIASSGVFFLGGYIFIDFYQITGTFPNSVTTHYVVRTQPPGGSSGFVMEIPDGISSSISSPYDVVADDTSLWITDNGNHRVIKYNKDSGAYDSTFGSSGSGNGQFSGPRGITKDSSGNVFVVDTGNNRVQKFNSSGVYQSQFGSSGSGNGQFNTPDRIYIDADDNVYVSDRVNNRVQVFDSSGSFLREFGTSGSGNGNLSSPIGVAKNPLTGHVYVANSSNSRIEVFKEFNVSTAKYVSRWGESGSGSNIRQFLSPEGVDTDAFGNMWIADTGNNRIARIASHGRLSTYYGTSGSGDGHFSSPSGLSVYNSELYVVDRGNNRIHKFIIGETSQLPSDQQTEFSYYMSPSGERSMGVPDRGLHTPDIAALGFPPSADELGDNAGTNLSATKYVEDMRRAVERLAASKVFTDPDDGEWYDWSSGTTNLYKRSLTNRHHLYGEDETVGVNKRTWTRGALRHKDPKDLDIGEIYETVERLKKAAWGVIE